MANPIAELIYSIGRKRGATPMEIKSALETGIVESGLRNLPGGSGDSAGWRQERRSLYPNPTNLEASINRYFDETEAVRGKYGRAGDLAAAVQRPAAQYRGRYQERSGDADALLRSLGGATAARSGRGAGVSVSGSVSPGRVTGNEFNPGEGAGSPLLGALLGSQPQAPPVAIPQAPLAPFVSPQVTPQGPQSGIGGLLAAVQTPAQEIPQTTVSPGSTSLSVKGTPQASAASVGGGRSPVAGSGKIIGRPYAGTHTLGNWQSDRAYDIAVPKGTPMVALQDGVIEKVTRHPQGSGRFAGDQITVRGANGNEYFYAHGVAHVRPGQQIRKGQKLGVTGSASGVEHLHFAQKRGNPAMHLRGR